MKFKLTKKQREKTDKVYSWKVKANIIMVKVKVKVKANEK
jgi:hypothetical protein